MENVAESVLRLLYHRRTSLGPSNNNKRVNLALDNFLVN
jgi:hypothetical protein